MKVYQKRRHHEHRWKTWVEPLVPKDGKDRTFLDLGCNAGFYMRKAEALGYRAIGLERDPEYISQAPKGLKIVQGDVNYYDPPLAYLTMLSCVHYHQTDEQVEAIMHRLMYSTLNLLVMSRHKGGKASSPSKEHLRKLMGGWKRSGGIDSGPFYTEMFVNKRYREYDVQELCDNTREFLAKNRDPNPDFGPSFSQFVRGVLDGKDNRAAFVKYLTDRKFLYPNGRCWIYKLMIEDIQANGLTQALIVHRNRMKDGYHRLIILKELGVKRVICRKWG